jgi:hypothetical protein
MKKILVFVFLFVSVAVCSIPVRAYVIRKSRSLAGTIVPNKWTAAAFPLTWQMSPNQPANVTGARTQSDVLNLSFQSWQSVATASVAFRQGAVAPATAKAGQYDNINLIGTAANGALAPGVLAYTYAYFTNIGGPNVFDEFERPVEFAGQIMEADMAFSPSFPFTTNAAAVTGQFDLQSVATHEAGHFLGLDHASNLSSTMFWNRWTGVITQRTLSADDIAGISTLYPGPSFASKGKISGIIRTTANLPVYGAIVVAVNSAGIPVASTLTDPTGAYTIEGLDACAYTVFAEPLSGRITPANIVAYAPNTNLYPGSDVNTNFTTRYGNSKSERFARTEKSRKEGALRNFGFDDPKGIGGGFKAFRR